MLPLSDDADNPEIQAIPVEELEKMSREEIRNLSREQKHAIYLRAFAINLEDEGLRSPEYYRDKSQCLSFEDISPAEMGIIKATKLKRGYIDPDELVRRLQQLKPSDNFLLREYTHRLMQWDKSPVKETSIFVPPPHSDWFLEQSGKIEDMRSQLGHSRTDKLRGEVQDDWLKKRRNVKLSPLPNLHLLRNMGHSPSGTLFPRYLVNGLRELRERANSRGKIYYREEYAKAKVRRRDIIHRWQQDRADVALAFDPVSMYRTWPSELMEHLDGADQEAMQRGRERYVTDLQQTEREMQTLVGFWRDCGLITGQRTPSSSPNPSREVTTQGKPRSSDSALQKPSATAEGESVNERNQRSLDASKNNGNHGNTSHVGASIPPSRKPSLITSDMVAPGTDVEGYRSNPLIGPKESSRLSETQLKNPLWQPPLFGVDTKTGIQSSAWCGRLRPRKEAPRLFNSDIGKPQKVRKRKDQKTPRNARRAKAKSCVDNHSSIKPAPSNSSGSQLHSDTAGPQTVATSVGKHRRSARLQQSL